MSRELQTLVTLEDNYLRAKDAMDEYILSVADPDVILALKEQRDMAKQAYVKHCEKNHIKVNL